jgi:hypothetical protein
LVAAHSAGEGCCQAGLALLTVCSVSHGGGRVAMEASGAAVEQKLAAGMCRLGPGMCRLGPGMCRLGPGMCRLGPGMCRLGPGMCRLGPGMCRLGPGMCALHCAQLQWVARRGCQAAHALAGVGLLSSFAPALRPKPVETRLCMAVPAQALGDGASVQHMQAGTCCASAPGTRPGGESMCVGVGCGGVLACAQHAAWCWAHCAQWAALTFYHLYSEGDAAAGLLQMICNGL